MSNAQTCGSYRYRWASILFLLVSVSLELQPVGNRLLDTVRLFQTSYDGPIHGNGIRLTRIVSDRKLSFAYDLKSKHAPPPPPYLCVHVYVQSFAKCNRFRRVQIEYILSRLDHLYFSWIVEVWELYLIRNWFIRFLTQTIEVHVQTCCLIISSTFFFFH